MHFIHRVCPQRYVSWLQSTRIAPRGLSQYWSAYGPAGGWWLSASWTLLSRLSKYRFYNYWSESWADGFTEAEF